MVSRQEQQLRSPELPLGERHLSIRKPWLWVKAVCLAGGRLWVSESGSDSRAQVLAPAGRAVSWAAVSVPEDAKTHPQHLLASLGAFSVTRRGL